MGVGIIKHSSLWLCHLTLGILRFRGFFFLGFAMSNEFVTVRRKSLEQEIEALSEAATALSAALKQPEQSPVAKVIWPFASALPSIEWLVKSSEISSEMLLFSEPKPAQQPEADKLLRQALEAMEVQGSEWVIMEQNAIAAIRKYFGEA